MDTWSEMFYWAATGITVLLVGMIVAKHYFNFPRIRGAAGKVSNFRYQNAFSKPPKSAGVGAKIERENIVNAILDIRKFEIDLYWKRTTYFWAFIALTYAAFGALATQKPDQCGASPCTSSVVQLPTTLNTSELMWFVACFGLFLSVAWHLVNKGSKYWQENWENHLDLLEDEFLGPLYKTVVTRPKREWWEVFGYVQDLVNGPAPFSVSKVNASLSFFNILVWSYLTLRLFLFDREFVFDPRVEHKLMIWVTAIVILYMIVISMTNGTDRPALKAARRRAKITLK